jgi:hypothetical protein
LDQVKYPNSEKLKKEKAAINDAFTNSVLGRNTDSFATTPELENTTLHCHSAVWETF